MGSVSGTFNSANFYPNIVNSGFSFTVDLASGVISNGNITFSGNSPTDNHTLSVILSGGTGQADPSGFIMTAIGSGAISGNNETVPISAQGQVFNATTMDLPNTPSGQSFPVGYRIEELQPPTPPQELDSGTGTGTLTRQ